MLRSNDKLNIIGISQTRGGEGKLEGYAVVK